MTRAGSFVAERILGTSGSSVRPLLLILITRQPPSEDKRVTAKAGRRFVQNQDWWSRARLVTVPRCAARPLLCRPTNPPVSRLLYILPAGPFTIPINDWRTLVFINCHGWSKPGVLFMGEIILRHYPFLFSIDADEPKLLGAKH